MDKPKPQPGSLKLMQFNAENLFVYLDHYDGQDISKLSEVQWQKYSSSTYPNKSLFKLKGIKDAIEDAAPDIVMFNEVGGKESLTNLNKMFLQEKFEVFLIEGNSDRGIDVGYLVRKDLPLSGHLFSHRNRPLKFQYPHEEGSDKVIRFSRDVAELHLFGEDKNQPLLILLLVHLKSKLDSEGIDKDGRLRREAELKALIEIYNDIRERTQQKVPMVVAGDFNGRADRQNKDPEFADLYEKSDLIDCFDAADIPQDQRFTQLQYMGQWHESRLQIDFIFVSPELEAKVVKEGTEVYRFKDHTKMALPIPKNFQQRQLLPSDHYPVVTVIKDIF